MFATSGNPDDADPSVAGMPTDGVANTNLVWHGGKLLALEEGHAPIEIDPLSLETRGVWRFDGRLTSNMTAHPKVDPDTGEMLFFSNIPSRKLSGEILFHVANSDGVLLRTETIQGPFAALVHDFAVTRDFVKSCQTPVLVLPDDVPAHPLAVAMERAACGPTARSFSPCIRRTGQRTLRA